MAEQSKNIIDPSTGKPFERVPKTAEQMLQGKGEAYLSKVARKPNTEELGELAQKKLDILRGEQPDVYGVAIDRPNVPIKPQITLKGDDILAPPEEPIPPPKPQYSEKESVPLSKAKSLEVEELKPKPDKPLELGPDKRSMDELLRHPDESRTGLLTGRTELPPVRAQDLPQEMPKWGKEETSAAKELFGTGAKGAGAAGAGLMASPVAAAGAYAAFELAKMGMEAARSPQGSIHQLMPGGQGGHDSGHGSGVAGMAILAALNKLANIRTRA